LPNGSGKIHRSERVFGLHVQPSPGLVTDGETLEHAREMARDAIRAYLDSLKKDGLPIPTDKKLALNPVKEELRVPVPG